MTILSDLQAFDKKYLNGVDPPSFKIVDENGNGRLTYQSISALQDSSSGEITVTSPTALLSSVTKGKLGHHRRNERRRLRRQVYC